MSLPCVRVRNNWFRPQRIHNITWVVHYFMQEKTMCKRKMTLIEEMIYNLKKIEKPLNTIRFKRLVVKVLKKEAENEQKNKLSSVNH